MRLLGSPGVIECYNEGENVTWIKKNVLRKRRKIDAILFEEFTILTKP